MTRVAATSNNSVPVKKSIAKKVSEVEAQERRSQVARLRMRGLSQENISKVLKISLSTVRRDLNAIKETNKKRIDEFEEAQFVGEGLSLYDEIIERSWAEYHAAKEGTPTKLKSLDLIRTTQNDKMKAMYDCGLISKESKQKLEVEHTFNVPWDENTKEAVINVLLQQSLTTQLPEPTPDPNFEGTNTLLESDDNDEEDSDG